jgi:hypothetical protein
MIPVPPEVRGAWETNRTRRPARIVETLKRGFDIGQHVQAWSADLKWLSQLRDAAVHPKVTRQPMRVHPSGVSVPGVDPDFPNAAARALQVAVTILRACLAAPRSTNADLVAWCDTDKQRAVDIALSVRDIVRPEGFESGRIKPPWEP